MLSVISEAFLMIIQPSGLLALAIGLTIGLIVGVVPGIGGPFALALLLPLCFNMDPVFGVIMMVSIVSSVVTGGSVTAILVGIPGTPPNAAQMLDGYPMMKNGEGGRALGACMMASALGGIVGALSLMVFIPFMRPLILTFGHPELFAISAFGLTFVAILSDGRMIRAFLATILGIIMSLVGMNPLTGVPRFDMGILYLVDGIGLIPVCLGLFALPEILDIYLGREKPVAKMELSGLRSDIIKGVKDVFIHWPLFLRTTLIGVLVGFIPGLGGETASFIAYGHAKQSSKDPDSFGHGNKEGVIGVSAALMAKEGGSLVPTLGFGIPGSVILAIFMGALIVLGYQPGPAMLSSNATVIQLMALLTAIANVLAAFLCLLAAKPLLRMATVRQGVLLPWVFMFIMIGAYIPSRSFGDVILTMVCGVIGFFMKEYHYPRIGVLLGLVLTHQMELNYFMGMEFFGVAMFLRPVVLVMIAITVITLLHDYLKRKKRNKKEAVAA